MSVNNESQNLAGSTAAVNTLSQSGVYASLFEKINLTPVAELGDVNGFDDNTVMAETSADARVTAAVKVLMQCLQKSGQKVEKLDKTILDHHIAELDFQIGRQLDEVMHHEAFQRTEGIWRGLKSLVDKTDFRQNVKLELLDLSKEELRQDFEDAPEIIQSGLYKQTYIAEYDTPGGEPIAAVISAYEFDASAQDVALMRNIAKVSAAAHMPFIGSVGPAFFLKGNMEQVAAIKDISNYFDRAEYIKWKSFRDTDDARYLGLVMPRVLGRLPYGPDKGITPQQMLMQDASLTLQAPVDQGFGIKIQEPVRTLQGVVTGFKRLSTSKDETHYSLTLQPRLALLSRSHQNRIYQDMSVPDIVEHILRTRHDMHGEDFVFTLANEYPRREQVMQYGEDDLTFISRLLAEVGIWYCVTADTRLNIDVLAFYDDQRYVGQGLTLPSVPPSGQHDNGTESVWALKSDHNVVEKSVFTRDYNYRNAPEDMSLSVDVSQGDSTTYGEAYHWADNYLTPGNSDQRDPEPESGAFYARIRHERYLNGQLQLNGATNCATLAPGQELKVTGGEEVTDTFRQGVVIIH